MSKSVIVRRNNVRSSGLKPLGMILLMALLALTLARPAPAEPPPGKWSIDYKDAIARAEAEKKNVLVMFSTSWCAPCNMMKRDVFTQDKVKNTLTGMETIYIDGDTGRDLVKQYNVRFYPSFVVLKPNGTELGRFVGYNDPDKFLKKLDIVQNQLRQLEVLLSVRTQDPALWMKRGRLYEALENPEQIDEVARSYRRAKTLDAQNQTGVAADADFFEAARVSSGDAEAADQRFADFINSHPNSPRVEDALFNRLDIAMREGKTDLAKMLLKQYQEKYPAGKYARVTEEITGLLSQPRPADGSLRLTPKGTAPLPPRGSTPPEKGPLPPAQGNKPTVPRAPTL